MRWIGSVVADVYRILIRGGVYLYPEDSRAGYEHGRLRLLYEANPIAFLIEQAGGAAIDGFERILDVAPQSLHARTPLIFGSKDKVERIRPYYTEGRHPAERRRSSAGAAPAAVILEPRTPAKMSIKHPIIAITGSSGAGTTSVKKTFEQIFRREKINAVYIEGDAFHRCDRAEMREQNEGGGARGRPPLQPFRHRRQPVRGARGDLRALCRDAAAGARATMSTTPTRPRRTALRRDLHALARVRAGLRPAVLRGPARRRRHRQGQRRPARRPEDRRRAGHQPRMDPEAASRQGHARLLDRGGDRHDPAAHAGLRPLHLSAVHRDRHQFPARADGRHVEPVHRALDPDAGRIDGRHPLPQSARHRLPLSAVDDPRQLHEPRQLDRHPRRQARPRDAADPDADDSRNWSSARRRAARAEFAPIAAHSASNDQGERHEHPDLARPSQARTATRPA